MKLIVIGAVAAGTSAAAKASRNDNSAEIRMYEKDKDISYSGCGIPYFIGGEIDDASELAPRDSKYFKKKYNIDVFTECEVLKILPVDKKVIVRNLNTDEVFEDTYDKLLIATGASPLVPDIKGISKKHVFFLRNIQSARNLKNFINKVKPAHALIAGTGFIGFEMLENLIEYGIDVTIIEKQNKITQSFDEDMAALLESFLEKRNIKIIKNISITEIKDNSAILENGNEIKSDLIIMATGVKPNTSLAKEAGIETGISGAIKVNSRMETNMKDIYACGDCIETFSAIIMKPVYRPLGSTANKTGRIAGENITGGNVEYKGNIGTGIFKLFNFTVASAGLSEKEARAEGYDVVICHNTKPDKPKYFNGSEMTIKAIADTNSQRILGVQIIGHGGVDKRIDVFATLISYGAKTEEIIQLDLAYAPPFSTVNDPVHYTGMILKKILKKR